MADARHSGARRSSGAHGEAVPTRSVAKEIKELNWFQKNVLCMNVEIRKGQYDAHLEREQLSHNQALILHQLKSPALPPPKQKSPVPYKKWTASSNVDWLEIERQLKGMSAPSGSSSQPARNDDEEDDEEDEESNGDSEDSYDFDADE